MFAHKKIKTNFLLQYVRLKSKEKETFNPEWKKKSLLWVWFLKQFCKAPSELHNDTPQKRTKLNLRRNFFYIHIFVSLRFLFSGGEGRECRNEITDKDSFSILFFVPHILHFLSIDREGGQVSELKKHTQKIYGFASRRESNSSSCH